MHSESGTNNAYRNIYEISYKRFTGMLKIIFRFDNSIIIKDFVYVLFNDLT